MSAESASKSSTCMRRRSNLQGTLCLRGIADAVLGLGGPHGSRAQSPHGLQEAIEVLAQTVAGLKLFYPIQLGQKGKTRPCNPVPIQTISSFSGGRSDHGEFNWHVEVGCRKVDRGREMGWF